MANPPSPFTVYVPVIADGHLIRDNGRDIIATCINPAIAQTIANALNKDAQRG